MIAEQEASEVQSVIGIMENDPALSRFLETHLQGSDFRIDPLSSAEEVNIALSRERVRNFVFDVDMGPDRQVEGLEALKIVKREHPDAFVCIYSSHFGDHPEYEHRARRLGADFILGKTTDPLEDVNRIRYQLVCFRGKNRECPAEHSTGTNTDIEPADADLVYPPPPSKFGRIHVKLKFRGRGSPFPELNPWQA